MVLNYVFFSILLFSFFYVQMTSFITLFSKPLNIFFIKRNMNLEMSSPFRKSTQKYFFFQYSRIRSSGLFLFRINSEIINSFKYSVMPFDGGSAYHKARQHRKSRTYTHSWSWINSFLSVRPL